MIASERASFASAETSLVHGSATWKMPPIVEVPPPPPASLPLLVATAAPSEELLHPMASRSAEHTANGAAFIVRE
jgi:hypothetical protein